jgi:hypothetical protein
MRYEHDYGASKTVVDNAALGGNIAAQQVFAIGRLVE